jgi:hypothetical protein
MMSSAKTRLRFGLRLGAALLLAGWAGTAQGIVGGQTGGPLDASAVMVLHDRGGVCTGVVVAPDVILTAAHCVPQGAQLRVHYRETGQPVLLETQAVQRHPGYRANAVKERKRSIDLALVKLPAPLPGRFEAATLSAAAPEGRVTVAGYGLGREGVASSTGTWRSVRLDVATPYGPSRILLWARGPAGSGGCHGDSGGPMIDSEGGAAAIMTWSVGTGGKSCGDLTQGVLLGAQREWIDVSLARWSRSANWR